MPSRALARLAAAHCAVPRIGDFSGGYRMVMDYETKNGRVRMVIDVVGISPRAGPRWRSR